ncbi:MAG: EamA family transporter [Verrucomicrobia bacterium]|nr:EamA family transporter [Cytophagales bacterium]
MNWLFLAILTAFCFGLYNFFLKTASGNIHQIAGAVILQLVAALAGLMLLLYFKTTKQALPITQKGVLQACLAGLCVGLAEMLSFVVFSKNVPASVGTPVIIGGSILVTTLLGYFFLRESLNGWQMLGLVLVIAGIALLSAGQNSGH